MNSRISPTPFWPSVSMQLHPRVASLLKRFGDTYALLKNPRKLEFKQQLGTAQIDLDFDNGVGRLNPHHPYTPITSFCIHTYIHTRNNGSRGLFVRAWPCGCSKSPSTIAMHVRSTCVEM